MASSEDQEKEITLNPLDEDIKNNRRKYFSVLLVLGLLNNTGYVIVNSSAQRLGHYFHKDDLMSLFTFCLVILGFATTFINSRYLLKIRHITKIRIVVFCYITSYIVLGLSNLIPSDFGFFMALFGTLVMGVSTTLGEQTNLGFLKGFQPDLISGWGSGTGFAGVFGAGINFILRFVDVPGYLIFMGMIPTTIIYYIGFSWLVEKKAQMIERSGQSFLRINEDSTDRLASTSVQQPDTNDAQEASIN